jgi:hypothetical protein
MTSMAQANHRQDRDPGRQRPRSLRRRAAAVAVPVTIVAALVVTAGAPARTSHRPRTVAFVATQTSSAAPDPAFPKPGDTLVASLRNTRRGHAIGNDQTACIVVTTAGPMQCTTTVKIPGGTFEVAFHESLTDTHVTAPISGGTGAFVGARGYFTLHETSAGVYRVVGHLR